MAGSSAIRQLTAPLWPWSWAMANMFLGAGSEQWWHLGSSNAQPAVLIKVSLQCRFLGIAALYHHPCTTSRYNQSGWFILVSNLEGCKSPLRGPAPNHMTQTIYYEVSIKSVSIRGSRFTMPGHLLHGTKCRTFQQKLRQVLREINLAHQVGLNTSYGKYNALRSLVNKITFGKKTSRLFGCSVG